MSAALFVLSSVTLEGRRVRLEPLDLERHWEGLVAIGLEPDLWKWTLNRVESADHLREYLETAIRERDEGRSLPFATVDIASGRIAGSTRFSTFDRGNRRAEIGWTWIGGGFRRSHVNTEAKYLMLGHGFETWRLKRIELKTHEKNERSRNAMLRIGCTFEGILRNYQTGDTGTRNSAIFSIVDTEWPAVKARLERMIETRSC
jgi:RimJ/RimL family protein N-acetyltransferase